MDYSSEILLWLTMSQTASARHAQFPTAYAQDYNLIVVQFLLGQRRFRFAMASAESDSCDRNLSC